VTTRSDYWQHKLSVYLHDPPHKCLNIQKYERWAKEIAEELNCSIAASEQYKNADMIASGLTRCATPKYNADANQNGAVYFAEAPVITHPVVNCDPLTLALSDGIKPDAVHTALRKLLAEDLERLPRPANDEERARRTFFYLHFALKKRLRISNTGGLGAAWDFLPADTRMPDHPIWHHTALTSAIASSLREDGGGNVSLAVFAITPVQAFITKARKLRDHWIGSVILSYLTFCGIRYLAQTLGPDHVVYPSLHDQSLVERWLGEYGMERLLSETDPLLTKILEGGSDIAAFPNKFVFIAPTAKGGEVCREIQKAVQEEWLRIAGITRDFICKDDVFTRLFDHQVSDYWQYSFASARLSKLNEDMLGRLLHAKKWKDEEDTIKAFSKRYDDDTARIYGATHSLTQSVLAAAKLKPNRLRKPQRGEKCPLCGEHEVLHTISHPENRSAREYKTGVTNFWDELRDRFNAEGSSSEVGRNERLCAVCSVKRFLPRALKQQKLQGEPLYDVIINADKFPATTEIAAHTYLQKMEEVGILPREKRSRFIDYLHESSRDEGLDTDVPADLKKIEEEGKDKKITLTNRDKYYALLLMDGDKMGDLINGATVTATWGDVIHPELRSRYDNPAFKPPQDALLECLGKKRTLNPALHAAISDSLNSFARFAVAPLVKKSGGRLVYAGGDDVCAILPLDTAIETADAIRRAYTAGFVRYTRQGVESLRGNAELTGKIGVHFAPAPGISISAAIVVAHHKQPLREVLKDAHSLLDDVAKRKTKRNAVAIRLKKRSGGDRDFACRWNATNPFMADETILDSFCRVAEVIGDLLSSSLLYRLASLKDAVSVLKLTKESDREKICKLFAYEVGHSGLLSKEQKNQVDTIAARLAGITLQAGEGTTPDRFNSEAAVIAGFIGRRERK